MANFSLGRGLSPPFAVLSRTPHSASDLLVNREIASLVAILADLAGFDDVHNPDVDCKAHSLRQNGRPLASVIMADRCSGIAEVLAH